MNKEKILIALNSIKDGESTGYFHDELETLTSIVLNSSNADKEKILAELNAMQNGDNTGNYDINALITIADSLSDEEIAEAWEDLRTE